MQKIKACTAQLHYTLLNTWKLLPPRKAFPPWLLCCWCNTGTVLNSGIYICQHCSMWSFTNLRSQTACNKPGNENRPIAIFSGTKHLPYGTRDMAKNSGTVPDVLGHLATMHLFYILHASCMCHCSYRYVLQLLQS